MVNAKGLVVSKSRFWALLRNPVYCGYVSMLSKETNERQLIKGLHQPIISESLFYDVQNIISTKRKAAHTTYQRNDTFLLRRYLICPICNRKLTGSYSQGKSKTYPYYHCVSGCKTRFNANTINDIYKNKLDQFALLPGVLKLFHLVLEDVNVNTQRMELLHERRLLLQQIAEQENLVSKARNLFIKGKIQLDDFSGVKKESQIIFVDLKDELEKVGIKLNLIQKQIESKPVGKIFSGFGNLDVNNKKHIVELIPPIGFDADGNFSLQLNKPLSKILLPKTNAIN